MPTGCVLHFIRSHRSAKVYACLSRPHDLSALLCSGPLLGVRRVLAAFGPSRIRTDEREVFLESCLAAGNVEAARLTRISGHLPGASRFLRALPLGASENSVFISFLGCRQFQQSEVVLEKLSFTQLFRLPRVAAIGGCIAKTLL
jgi:hypothetical protein